MPPTTAQTKKGAFAFEILQGQEARDWAARGLGKAAWTKLYEDCPWSTAFQSPGFFEVWSKHYAASWSPLVIIGRRVDGTVAGIMPLAAKPGLITGAGAHQAEYHGWISSERDAEAFVGGALATIAEAMPGQLLRLRYLPPALPPHLVAGLVKSNPRLEIFRNVSHEFAIDRQRIAEALKKKSNKSKQNRLARLGRLSFRKLDAGALASQMNAIAAMYDFRQGARNGVCPFLDDPQKGAFHLDWMKSLPGQVHATGMFLGDRLISALLLVTSRDDAHLAIAAHAPDVAEHSPNKLHIYEAAAMLADEGRSVLDLTPGDDAWKERFSTGTRAVVELVMHASLQRAGAARARKAVKDLARRTLARLGISKKSVVGRLRAAKNGAEKAVGAARVGAREDTLALELATATTASDGRVSCNDLDALMRWGGGLVGERRQPFLDDALRRIELGDCCYTLRSGDSLAGLVWLSAPQPEQRPTLRDFAIPNGAEAGENLRTLVGHVLQDLRAKGVGQATARVSPRERVTRDALAALGFRLSTSLHPRYS
jgi:CelD/BcsL family acetyltransferase involved in cellulose biosynthesis